MSSDTNNKFIDVIEVANIAAEAYSKTQATFFEEAILKLTLQGEFDLADKFEEGLKQLKKNNEEQ